MAAKTRIFKQFSAYKRLFRQSFTRLFLPTLPNTRSRLSVRGDVRTDGLIVPVPAAFLCGETRILLHVNRRTSRLYNRLINFWLQNVEKKSFFHRLEVILLYHNVRYRMDY